MRRLRLLVAVAAFPALALSACSSTTSGGPDTATKTSSVVKPAPTPSASSTPAGPPANAANQLIAKLNDCSLITPQQMTTIARKYTHVGATFKLTVSQTKFKNLSGGDTRPIIHYCEYTDPSSDQLDILNVNYFANPSSFKDPDYLPDSRSLQLPATYGSTEQWSDGVDYHYNFSSPDVQIFFGGTGDQSIEISDAKLQALLRDIASAVLAQITTCLKSGC